MCGEMMVGKCEVCGKENVALERTYFRYDIPCECHGPSHFICVDHCKDCVPKEPRESKVTLKTEDLKDPYKLAEKIIEFANEQKEKRQLKISRNLNK